MFATVIALNYALLVSQWSYGHFLKLADLILFEQHDKSSPFNSTRYVVLYPQNGDHIVTIDSVTSLHPMCILFENYVNILALEMASPGKPHCANCIGTLSFPMGRQ